MSSSHSRHASRASLRDFAENLPFLHPQPTPRSSREWSLNSTRRTNIGLPTPASSRSNADGRNRGGVRTQQGWAWWLPNFTNGSAHRRQLSLSSFSPKGCLFVALLLALVLVLGISWNTAYGGVFRWPGFSNGVADDGGVIPLGQSRERGGREVFWWEQFDRLYGFYGGRKALVEKEKWISEQERKVTSQTEGQAIGIAGVKAKRTQELVDVTANDAFAPCYVDQKKGMMPPKLLAYHGIQLDFPASLFGSHKEIGLRDDVCYDRINRFGPYGFGFTEEEGGLGIKMDGDDGGRDAVQAIDYRNVQWGEAQAQCIASKMYTGPRTAFVIRTWNTFQYTPYHIMMLRALVSELALSSGGRYTVHFLIHVQDESLPIWASDDVYNQVLSSSLPSEFVGMGTLWSVAQMKLIYPPPFPSSIVNFSGDEIYKAYRSLHFPLQYFAQQHPEFEYFWEWEMDIRVTGGYLELLEQITKWAEKQDSDLSWEKSARFFISALFNNSYATYEKSIQRDLAASGTEPISGPRLPESQRINIPGVTDKRVDDKHVDLITFSPLFNPQYTKWAFHDDITGYLVDPRPPTRAALVTASRLSRRLLLTMHHETFEKKRTMFPEMFPASIALHYGYKAVYAPLPMYFDKDWPAWHADEVFNNGIIGEEAHKAGMDHGFGHFHGKGGSVFGPGEHVFQGASWYSNARFAGYLWRRWLGRENGNNELEWERDVHRGRMCLPMMVVHPVKNE